MSRVLFHAVRAQWVYERGRRPHVLQDSRTVAVVTVERDSDLLPRVACALRGQSLCIPLLVDYRGTTVQHFLLGAQAILAVDVRKHVEIAELLVFYDGDLQG
jgi:hypothetical protein